MCCHSPAGRAGLDGPRWHSPLSHSSASFDFAWLMNCDGTQLQGCLCDIFFFARKPVGAGAWSIVELCWWLSTFISAGSAASVTQSSEHLKDPHCQDVGVAGCTASCLCFNTERGAQTMSQTCPDMIYLAQFKMSQPCDRKQQSPQLQGTYFTSQFKKRL